jgi:hypothetical protein
MIKYIQLLKSKKENKRFEAKFFDIEKNKIKSVNFGLKGGNTFIEHKNTKTKDAWIARHSVTGDWTKPDTASSLAFHILWNKPTLSASFNDYLKKFNLKKY